jgi:hypothetical protein
LIKLTKQQSFLENETMLAFGVARTGTSALAVPSMWRCPSNTLFRLEVSIFFYLMTKVTFVKLSDLSDLSHLNERLSHNR